MERDNAMYEIHHLIDGRSTPSTSGRTAPVYNPATGEVQATVGLASIEEVDAAVAAAVAAFPAWRATALSRRAEVMFRLRGEPIDANRKDWPSHQQRARQDGARRAGRGGPRAGERGVACGVPHLLKGATRGRVGRHRRVPAAPAARRGGRHHPVQLPGHGADVDVRQRPGLRELLRAEAVGEGPVGRTVPGRPAAPGRHTRRCVQRGAGRQGGRRPVARAPRHRRHQLRGLHPDRPVDLPAGHRQREALLALGGAKNHMLVLPDADVDMAADAAVSAAYGSAGERCMAISVVLAVGEVADPLVDAITARLPAIKVGPGTDPDAEMGPLVTGEHRDRVVGYLDSAAAAGATVVADGRRGALPADGFFLGPCLLDRVTPDMACYTDEIFGPVLSVVRVGSYAEGLSSSTTTLGNGTAIFTRDGGAARRFQYECNVGMVGVNVPIRCRCRTTASVGGRRRCSATGTCTARKAWTSTPARRWSPSLARPVDVEHRSRLPQVR
ncbi:MAG: aldehyde dehydrogenase family protein [Acidimicrobiales bacterium]